MKKMILGVLLMVSLFLPVFAAGQKDSSKAAVETGGKIEIQVFHSSQLGDRDHAFRCLDSVGMDIGKGMEPKGIKLLGYMENDTVDGQENPSAHIFKCYYEVQKYASKTAHAYAPEPVLVSLAKWNSLSESIRKVIEDSAKEAII